LKAVIFDLDNCLSPVDQFGPELFEPAFAAIRAANDGSVPQEQLAESFAAHSRHSFDWIANRYRYTPAMYAAGSKAWSQAEVTSNVVGYEDLPLLEQVPGERFLVTTGFRRLQESKIAALDITRYFAAVVIDGLEDRPRKDKRCRFQEIMAVRNLRQADVLIVGDSHEAELTAAKSLGIRSVQTLRPRVARSDIASFHVSGLSELLEVMRSL
jgi:FMN phosphatase YigB (HAD superfamily)